MKESEFQRLAEKRLKMDEPFIDLSARQDIKVNFISDKTVKPGLFIPLPGQLDQYRAHPHTIKALRTDLFVVGMEVDFLKKERPCSNCHQTIDLHFYKACPYCGEDFLQLAR